MRSASMSAWAPRAEPDRTADCRHELPRSQNAADHPPAAIELVEEVQPETDEDGNVIAGQQAGGTILSQSPTETHRFRPNVINVTVMGGDGWEDPNQPIQIEIPFDLPEGDGVVHVQTFVDGTETGYGDPDLSRQSTWTTRPSRGATPRWRSISTGSSTRPLTSTLTTHLCETTDLQGLGEQLSQQGGSYGENTRRDYPEPQE